MLVVYEKAGYQYTQPSRIPLAFDYRKNLDSIGKT